jgi:hypothetical protein
MGVYSALFHPSIDAIKTFTAGLSSISFNVSIHPAFIALIRLDFKDGFFSIISMVSVAIFKLLLGLGGE